MRPLLHNVAALAALTLLAGAALAWFAQVTEDDVAGNRLFQSYLNMAENPHIALIFFIPGIRETVRVNGTVEIVDRAALDDLQVELQVFNPDENAKILQGVVVNVEESYGHCPRALAFSRFWDADRIAENSKRS